MGPTIGKLDLLLAVSKQAIVSGIAIDLQDASKAFQDIPGVFSPAPGSIGKGHAGWIIPTRSDSTYRFATRGRGPVITCQRPEVAGFRLAASGVENRCNGFVHEQFGRAPEIGNQGIKDGLQLEGRLADPGGQCRTIQIDALAAVDLRLAIERKMIGVFADENMGDHRLGRHPALDQMRRRRGLNNATLAGPAGIFGAPRDDDPDRPQVAKR